MSSKKLYGFFVSLFLLQILNGSGVYAQGHSSKEISQEAALPKGSLIRIVSSSGKLNIKSWDQQKVKVTVRFTYDSLEKSGTIENWFDYLGISIKPFSNRVDILTRTAFAQGKMPAKIAVGVYREAAAQDAKLKTIPRVGGFKDFPYKSKIEIMTVMVPLNSKLDLENKYGDVVIGMDLDDAKLEVSNGTLDAQNFKNLNLISDYCNVNLGNVEKGEVEFYNGTFKAQNVKDLDMDSRSSNIEYEKGEYLYLRSQTDEIDIQEINKVDGRKVYGSIKIDQLNGSFDLEGNNVDVKFRNISPEVSLIKINNKYGDVRLPVKSLKNYFVDFTGYYSTVFAPFQKQIVKEDEAAAQEEEKIAILKASQNYKPGASVGELAPRRFTSTVGDNKAKHTRIELICNSCTVDFK
jgi:hypothetical protein